MDHPLEDDVCQTRCLHRESVDAALAAMPPEKELRDLAEFYKLFADPTRLRILSALGSCELCVCDLAETLKMSHSAVSHQLRLLRAGKLVKYRRQGKMAFYSLDDHHVETVVTQGLAHIRE